MRARMCYLLMATLFGVIAIGTLLHLRNRQDTPKVRLKTLLYSGNTGKLQVLIHFVHYHDPPTAFDGDEGCVQLTVGPDVVSESLPAIGTRDSTSDVSDFKVTMPENDDDRVVVSIVMNGHLRFHFHCELDTQTGNWRLKRIQKSYVDDDRLVEVPF